MHRRTFLSGLTPGIAAIAGCADGSTDADESTADGGEAEDQSATDTDDETASEEAEQITTNFFYHEVQGTVGTGGETVVELAVTVLVPPDVERADVVDRVLALGEWQGDPDDSETATTFVHADAASADDHSYALHEDVPVERYDTHEDWPAYEVVAPLGTDGPGAGDNSGVAPIEAGDEPDLGLLTDEGHGNWKTLSVPDSFAVYGDGDEVELLR